MTTLTELRQEQDESSSSLDTIKSATETTRKDLRSLHAQSGPIQGFNFTADKTIQNTRELLEAGAPPTPEAP